MDHFDRVARTSEITPGNGRTVIVAGIPVTLFKVDGSFHAIQDPCVDPDEAPQEIGPPQRVSSCMWHGWEYDVRTGESLTAPGTYARTFEVNVAGDDVFVRMPI